MKKLGFIVLAVILVLGTLGVGYAWTAQTINISGTAQVAQVQGQFYGGYYGTNPYTVTDANGINHSVTVGIYTNSTTNDTLTVTISNMYPNCYIPNFNLYTVYNSGTIPLMVASATPTYNSWYFNSISVTAPTDSSIMPGNASTTWGKATVWMVNDNTHVDANGNYAFSVVVNCVAPSN